VDGLLHVLDQLVALGVFLKSAQIRCGSAYQLSMDHAEGAGDVRFQANISLCEDVPHSTDGLQAGFVAQQADNTRSRICADLG
jgi:hypothetical protein